MWIRPSVAHKHTSFHFLLHVSKTPVSAEEPKSSLCKTSQVLLCNVSVTRVGVWNCPFWLCHLFATDDVFHVGQYHSNIPCFVAVMRQNMKTFNGVSIIFWGLICVQCFEPEQNEIPKLNLWLYYGLQRLQEQNVGQGETKQARQRKTRVFFPQKFTTVSWDNQSCITTDQEREQLWTNKNQLFRGANED